MKDTQPKISVGDLTEIITSLIKNEIIATYKEENNTLHIHFINGQIFCVKVEEFQ